MHRQEDSSKNAGGTRVAVSAFVGILQRDNRPVQITQINTMLERIAHRGPDGATTWSDGAIGFGHRVLRLTPKSRAESIPAHHPSLALTFTGDARVDNVRELMESLMLDPRAPLTNSALVLCAYMAWGERCAEHLIGDFAFAVWDHSRNTLYCARDRFGILPFYYSETPERCIFASDPQAFLDVPHRSERLREAYLANHLPPSVEEPTDTCSRDILRLPPGHALTVSRDRITMRQYCALDSERAIPSASDDQHTEPSPNASAKSGGVAAIRTHASSSVTHYSPALER